MIAKGLVSESAQTATFRRGCGGDYCPHRHRRRNFQNALDLAATTGNKIIFLLLWPLGGLMSLVGALCYAELASAYPSEGGDYRYLRRSFGKWVAFYSPGPDSRWFRRVRLLSSRLSSAIMPRDYFLSDRMRPPFTLRLQSSSSPS